MQLNNVLHTYLLSYRICLLASSVTYLITNCKNRYVLTRKSHPSALNAQSLGWRGQLARCSSICHV